MDYTKLYNEANALYTVLFGMSSMKEADKQSLILQIMQLLQTKPHDMGKEEDSQKQLDEVIKRGRKASNKTGE